MLHPMDLMMMSRGTRAGQREMLVIALCQGGVGDRPAASLVKYADELVEALNAMTKLETDKNNAERQIWQSRKAQVDKALEESVALLEAKAVCDTAARERSAFDKKRHEEHLDIRLKYEKMKKGKARTKVAAQAQEYWRGSCERMDQLQANYDKAVRARDEVKNKEYERLCQFYGYVGVPKQHDD